MKQIKSSIPQKNNISRIMSKQNQNKNQDVKKPMLFGRENYKYVLIGLAFITLGFILMSGGGSDDPNVWNPEIFNFRRIRLAPMLILFGILVEVYAIMRNPR